MQEIVRPSLRLCATVCVLPRPCRSCAVGGRSLIRPDPASERNDHCRWRCCPAVVVVPCARECHAFVLTLWKRGNTLCKPTMAYASVSGTLHLGSGASPSMLFNNLSVCSGTVVSGVETRGCCGHDSPLCVASRVVGCFVFDMLVFLFSPHWRCGTGAASLLSAPAHHPPVAPCLADCITTKHGLSLKALRDWCAAAPSLPGRL